MSAIKLYISEIKEFNAIPVRCLESSCVLSTWLWNGLVLKNRNTRACRPQQSAWESTSHRELHIRLRSPILCRQIRNQESPCRRWNSHAQMPQNDKLKRMLKIKIPYNHLRTCSSEVGFLQHRKHRSCQTLLTWGSELFVRSMQKIELANLLKWSVHDFSN